jgi:hypothetical protein
MKNEEENHFTIHGGMKLQSSQMLAKNLSIELNEDYHTKIYKKNSNK